MKITAFTINNPKYKIFNHPQEDSFKFEQHKNKTIIAVADGITRDPIGITNFPEKPSHEEIRELSKKYPRPSPARKAADLFCNSILKKLKSPSQIMQAITYANNQINQLNQRNNPHPDYLENDFWACVASCGIIEKNILYYAFICDCGVCVFAQNGKLNFITQDDGPNKHNENIWNSPLLKGKKWSDAQARRIQRSHFRNNPKEPSSYGALTGEKAAMNFVKTGRRRLEKDQFVFFFSDGMRQLLISPDFDPEHTFDKLENYLKLNAEKIDGSEGTLVALKL